MTAGMTMSPAEAKIIVGGPRTIMLLLRVAVRNHGNAIVPIDDNN